ncbi:opioid growth factor receptor conserved region-domain-containing protein [Ampelomyces quisqualis]|uniref:Opioid growth factor receptor conserved region-domain-containing protein n=1 Tax=Ampelomyces quisqualis TaxID=50730 RepID=A0A6A5QG55_AMPQU|nr:opioid growth factor receptor conserved region-domain-containing protein [Ampelomyces quisqualis]
MPKHQRSLNQNEKNKVRAARADFFKIHKRKKSTTKDQHLENDSTTTNKSLDTMASSKCFKLPGLTSKKPSSTASKTPLIIRFYDTDVQARDAHGRTQEEILSWPDCELERCHNYIQMLFPVPEGSAFNWEAPIIDREVMDAFRTRGELRSRLRLSFERMLHFYGFKIAAPSEEISDTKAFEVEAKSDAVQENRVEDAAKAEDTSAKSRSRNSAEEEASNAQDPMEKNNEENTAGECSSVPSSPPIYCLIRAPNWRQSFQTWAVRFDHNHLRITRILRCLRILGLQSECDAFFEALKLVYNDPSFNISERTMSYWTRAVTRPLYIAPDDDRIEWLKEWEDEQEKLKLGKGQGQDR